MPSGWDERVGEGGGRRKSRVCHARVANRAGAATWSAAMWHGAMWHVL